MPTEMKDGLGNEFTLRTKDLAPSQNNSVRQNWHLATRYPLAGRINTTPNLSGGSYRTTLKSGVMVANPAFTNLPIVSFRFVSASLIAIMRRMELSMWSLGTGFAAGLASFDAFVARAYTTEDTGGITAPLSGNVGKLRTDMQTTTSHLQVANTGLLTAGVRTLDGSPFENITAGITTVANTLFVNDQMLYQEQDHPLVLAPNEGVIVQATVPATGTWSFNVTAAWDEVEAINY